ncbi:MAG: hypothetical protein ABI580_09910 [Burkholderiaceae bacterium]
MKWDSLIPNSGAGIPIGGTHPSGDEDGGGGTDGGCVDGGGGGTDGGGIWADASPPANADEPEEPEHATIDPKASQDITRSIQTKALFPAALMYPPGQRNPAAESISPFLPG